MFYKHIIHSRELLHASVYMKVKLFFYVLYFRIMKLITKERKEFQHGQELKLLQVGYSISNCLFDYTCISLCSV